MARVKAGSTRPVRLVLVIFLQLVRRIAEHLSVVLLHDLLWNAEPLIKHVLIVLNKRCIPAELVIETVLRVAKDVTPVGGRGHVTGGTVGTRPLVILAQVSVEGALSVGRSVVGAEATRRVRDVGVTTASIVYVHDRLRVDVGQWLSRTHLQVLERA